MDDATRNDFHNRAIETLALLGDDPAEEFRRMKITGDRSNRSDCVVSLLDQIVPAPEGHRWLSNRDHVRLQNTAERESVLIVFTPDALRDFGEKFDQGRYPDLINPE